MIIGVLGDTHDCNEQDIIKTVNEEFLPRGVQVIVHTGDIQCQHIKPELFANLPVICVLTSGQAHNPNFSISPGNWRYVRPPYFKDPPKLVGIFDDKRANKEIRDVMEYFQCQRIHCRLVPITAGGETIMAYCGHERSFDALTNPQNVSDFFARINQVYDGVKVAFTGHTHHQFVFRHGNITWVNPGSIIDSLCHTKEFAVVNTANWEVVLGRLSNVEARISPVTVGIVSDTGNIDQLDSGFWSRLVNEFNQRGVTQVICCGNFHPIDIGRAELSHLQVHYYLLPGMEDKLDKPANWHLLPPSCPIVEIGGHRFYVQHGISPKYATLSEYENNKAFGKILEEHQYLDFIIAGLVPGTILQETDAGFTFINPGDARDHNYFATVCLPRKECTVSTISS